MGEWLDSLTGWLTLHPQWLGVAIFAIACIECLAIAGIVVPGTVVLFAVAVLAGNGALSLSETLLLGYAGGLLGDAISYALGRRFHQNIRGLPLLRTHPQWLETAESYIQRYGVASLLVGRFIGPLRPMLPMVAGMLDMPLPRFILVSLVAAAGWSVAYLLPGWATGAAFRLPLPDDFWPQAGIVVACIALLMGLSLHATWRNRERGTMLIALASLIMLIALFFGFPHLSALDNGLKTLVQEHRSEAAETFVVLVTRIGDFRTQFMVAGLLTVLLLITRQWRPALFACSTMLITALLNGSLKHLVARQRPDVLLEPLTTFSMPSGHSSAAFAFFLSLAILAGRRQTPRMRLVWVILASIPALSIALSRVYLGAHWPTDIMAGTMLACFVCASCLAAVEYRKPLPAMPLHVWWLVVPACALLLGFFAVHGLPMALEQYRYM